MTCEELFQEIERKEQKQKDVSYEVRSLSLVSVDDVIVEYYVLETFLRIALYKSMYTVSYCVH